MADIVEKNGIRFCSVCGKCLERKVKIPLLDGKGSYIEKRVGIVCDCQLNEDKEKKERLKFEDEQRRVSELRKLSLIDAKMANAFFNNYKISNENRRAFNIAVRYVDQFDVMTEKNQGLLFWGDVGTGKSYTAAVIANELMKRHISVVMTSFIKLINELNGFEQNDTDYINKLNAAKLLVIDDLGAERCTDYALEKVYDVIDSRYRSNKPIILTTNLDFNDMKKCTDIRYSRIYDRIFEICYPIKMEGLSWRKKEAVDRYGDMKKILEG